MDLVRHVRENFRDTEVMMITGYRRLKERWKQSKTGAEEFLAKPFTDTELLAAVERVLDKAKIHRSGRAEPGQTFPAHKGLIGKSEGMNKIFISIGKASSASATVLITGESGTGKELAARAIHYGGPRSSAPVCAGQLWRHSRGLLESELFGHVKGAFTGATESRGGIFSCADGGTIFLDEISDMSLAMQVKLLRVLQDKEVCMVGSNRSRKIDVRILAATNKNFAEFSKEGLFREDLFYRLNVITINIPPLRERQDDVLLLANYYLTRFAAESGKASIRFSDEALQSLRSYNWPGNVRELENVIQRLVVMTDGDVIEVPDLPSLMRFSALRKMGFTRTLAEVEGEYITNVLASMDGNKTVQQKSSA